MLFDFTQNISFGKTHGWTYSCPDDICPLHIPPVILLHILQSQCYASLLYLCYLLPMIKSPEKINRVAFFSSVISAPFLKVIHTLKGGSRKKLSISDRMTFRSGNTEVLSSHVHHWHKPLGNLLITKTSVIVHACKLNRNQKYFRRKTSFITTLYTPETKLTSFITILTRVMVKILHFMVCCR